MVLLVGDGAYICKNWLFIMSLKMPIMTPRQRENPLGISQACCFSCLALFIYDNDPRNSSCVLLFDFRFLLSRAFKSPLHSAVASFY